MQKLGVKVGASVGRPFDVLAGFRMFSLDVVGTDDLLFVNTESGASTDDSTSGELFLGKSFGALDRDEPPTYLEDVDKHFLLCGLDASFPWLYSALSRIPVPAVQHFFRARQRLLKTVVSMQCYTTQHDPTIYTDPDIWDPERWLSPSVLSFEWKELFMPFSKGLQACPGRNLALMKLKLVTAFLVDRYKVAVAPETTAESMAMRDHFLVVLKGVSASLFFGQFESQVAHTVGGSARRHCIGIALLAPMLLMVLRNDLLTNLLTVSVCVLAFAVVGAIYSEGPPRELLIATAAYAAVLVVFVGISS
ncbi:hypothetical protein H2199_004350 [Coniosporium tulheliwenetii]|uniref:Uncharacterized protein n=1 Tax=Coniosporium tulheliwenetii TaxID=3383036 RepID=A0ACC2Z5B3_9PEZI|nr:hypothetical protein H2199_004350 [Cladosporium sp. JES 115]